MKWLPLTQTDMNAYLQRGNMFVISKEQLKLLLSHAHIQFEGQYKIPAFNLIVFCLSILKTGHIGI